MSNIIEKVISKFAVQTAVHWANPVNPGYGTNTYDEPVEIAVRWDQMTKLITNRKNEELISTGLILTNTEAEEDELVYLGTLASLLLLGLDIESGDTYPLPETIQGVFKIVSKEKTPMVMSTTDFVRMYYLKPNWEQKV